MAVRSASRSPLRRTAADKNAGRWIKVGVNWLPTGMADARLAAGRADRVLAPAESVMARTVGTVPGLARGVEAHRPKV